jgi:hypothetical protein
MIFVIKLYNYVLITLLPVRNDIWCMGRYRKSCVAIKLNLLSSILPSAVASCHIFCISASGYVVLIILIFLRSQSRPESRSRLFSSFSSSSSLSVFDHCMSAKAAACNDADGGEDNNR